LTSAEHMRDHITYHVILKYGKNLDARFMEQTIQRTLTSWELKSLTNLIWC